MDTFQDRVCRQCGDRIRGRSDKRFCDDRCRNQFHNQQRRLPVLTERARQIQRRLTQNRRVLEGCLGGRKRCIISRDELLLRGFLFDLFSQRRQEADRIYFYCLDLGYRLMDAGRVLVFRVEGVGIFL